MLDASRSGYVPQERQPKKNEPVVVKPPEENTMAVMIMDDGTTAELWDFKHHVMDEMREPGMDDSTLAKKIIEAGYFYEFTTEMRRFHNLDESVARTLISKVTANDVRQAARDIEKNIAQFDPMDHKKIALDFLEMGVGDILLNLNSDFTGLDEEIFSLIVEKTHERYSSAIFTPTRLVRYGVNANTAVEKMFKHNRNIPIENVTGLNQDTATLLLRKPNIYVVKILQHPESFEVPPADLDKIISSSINDITQSPAQLAILANPDTRARFPLTTREIVGCGLEVLAHAKDVQMITKLIGLLRAVKTFDQPIHPIEESLQQLEKLQAHATKREYDPWFTDLEPLVAFLVKNEVMRLDSSQDGQLLVEYVKRFGMSNTPTIAGIFFGINKDGIHYEFAKPLGEFLGKKIEAKTKDKALLNELEQKQRWLLKELLADEIPKGIETVIGLEALNLIKGSTYWKQADTPEGLITTWKQTAEKKPELAKLPEHYVEYQIEVPVFERKIKTEAEEKELEVKQAEVLALQTVNKDGEDVPTDLGVLMTKIYEANKSYASLLEDPSKWWQEQQTRFSKILAFDLEKKLSERRQVLIEKGLSGEKLESSLRGARKALEDQAARFNATLKGILEINIPASLKEEQADGSIRSSSAYTEPQRDIVAFMEQLVQTLPKSKETDEILLAVSFKHFDLMNMEYGWEDAIGKMQTQAGLAQEKKNLLMKHFENISSLFRDYISEHYLQPQQRESHTGHTPFSPELLKALESVWSRTQKEHLFTKLRNKLEVLEKGEQVETKKQKKISLVPAKGVMRIFAGDTGDACYTSQHEELARGEYPGITVYSFVTNRGTSSERVQGSVLFIETTTKEKITDDFGTVQDVEKKVLLVRANNPRTNLLSQVDADKLVEETLNVAIDLAIQRGLDLVAVPRDNASESSSNRPDVSAYYKNHFAKAKKIALNDIPETNFNEYDSWNAQGNHAVVPVWNKERME